MDTLNTTTTADRPRGPAVAPVAPSVEGYEVLEEIARGGMGVVYKARQASLDRIVAIKTILAGWSGHSEVLRRFRTEAETIARLDHPNLVAIHQVGDSGGIPYLVMEYVSGGTLEKQLGGHPQPPRQAAALVETLARVLHAVHQRGVVHRDLKPGNVLLTESGVPKISDFGLARQIENRSGLTLSGDVLGTPDYMAPEQADGRSGEAGPQADLFSLGAMLYEMLVGKPPFAGGPVWQVLERVRSREPIPPRRLQPAVPRDLETITLHCLEKDPARRYQDARELADDLARFLAGEPIVARATPAWERAWMWTRRHPAVTVLAALCVLSLAVLVGGGLVYHRRIEAAYLTARTAVEEGRQRLVRLSLAHGEQALDEEASLEALGWFIEAARLDESAGAVDPGHRIRIATILRDAPELRQLWFHGTPGGVAALHPGGRRVLLGGAGNVVRLYDTATGQPVGETWRHDSAPVAAAFLAAESRIVVACQDGTVHVHDVAARRTRMLPGPGGTAHAGPVTALAVSSDGAMLLTAGGDGAARLWSASAVAPPQVNIEGLGRIVAADLAGNGSRFAVANADGRVELYDAGGRRIGSPLPHPARVHAVRLDPSGDRLATACADGNVRLFDRGGRPQGEPLRHRRAVVQVRFDLSGDRLVSASEDNTARLWDAASGRAIGWPLWHGSDVEDARFSDDGRRVVTCSDDNTARVWDAASGDPLTPQLPHNGTPRHGILAAGRLLTASSDGAARLWDLTDTRPAPPAVPLPPEPPAGEERTDRWPSPDGRQVLTAEGEHGARLRDARGAPLSPLLPHGGAIHLAVFSPTGDLVLTAGDDNRTHVWRTRDGAPVGRPLLHRATIRYAAFSPDSSRLFLASADLTGRVRDLESGRPLTPRYLLPGRVRQAAFSDDGQRVSARLDDGIVRTRDLSPDPRPLEELEALAVLLGGRRIDEHGESLPIDLPTLRQLWERRAAAPR